MSDPAVITAQPSPSDPRVCLFTADRPILAGGSYRCADREVAQGSPLLKALFGLPGITQVWVEENRLSLEKSDPDPWSEIGREVGRILRDYFTTGGAVVPAAPLPKDAEERLRRIAVEVLDREINPSLAAHGGRAELVNVRGRDLDIRLVGGCQGCGAAQLTLTFGIEKRLRERLPELGRVVDVTDHAGGVRPFFAKGTTGASPLQ
jgi:Fe-S cluster biogenesis protein NfuA